MIQSAVEDIASIVAAMSPEVRLAWEERAAIREYDGGYSRPEAERLALCDIEERKNDYGKEDKAGV